MGVASLAIQHLSGNEEVLYNMYKHHRFGDVVTQQPACFVKRKEREHRASALDVLPFWIHSSLP